MGRLFAATKLTEAEKEVLEACFNATAKNPVTRQGLKDITKLKDNHNRLIIGSLRDKGYPILYRAEGNTGYWIGTEEEYNEWIVDYIQYAVTIFKRKAAMDGYYTRKNQISMEDLNNETES